MSGGPYQDSNLKDILGGLVRRFDELERKIGGISPREREASLVVAGRYDLPGDTDTSQKEVCYNVMKGNTPSITSVEGGPTIMAQIAESHRSESNEDPKRIKIGRYVPRGWPFSEDNV